MSGFCVSTRATSDGTSDRLILLSPASRGRKSATAAAITTTSAPSACSRIAPRISSAVPTATTVAPAGGSTSIRPATSTTSAPRERAVRASSTPWRPLLRLPRKRTGSQGSWVPPALMTTRRPRRSSSGRPRRSRSSAAATMADGSGSRPGPLSAPVSRPTAGSRTTTPRARNCATLCWVAGCSHISVCIAGASTTGQRAVSSTLVSRSSASPCVARAIRSAVAGATRMRSASWPRRTCGTRCASVQTSVATGLPGQGRPGGRPDEAERCVRGHDGDVGAGLAQAAQDLAGLVGGNAAGHAEDDLRRGGHGTTRPSTRWS